ncbi:MAG: TolB family protein [Pyrinomonadaceae bacterium]
MAVKDGSEKIVTSQEWTRIEAFEWLPDGSGLVVVAADRETAPLNQVWHLAYPGGEVRRITNDTNDYRNISLTPDASSFVTVQTETVSNVWVAPDADAARATEVTSNKNDGRLGLSWTSNGSIVYQSRASGNANIWITDKDGRNQKQLTTGPGSDFFPVAAPDGRYISFLSNRAGGRLKVWRMNSDGGDPRPLISGLAGSYQPAADNQFVYYISNADGKTTLWRIPLDGGSPAQLTDYSVLGPMVSPDGKQLACAFVDEQARSYRVGILGLEGGAPIKVLELQRSSD